MSSTYSDQDRLCARCGAPLVACGLGVGCVQCFATNGIGTKVKSRTSNETRYVYQHYEILHREDGSLWELDTDSISVTYKARDVNLEMIVALKVLNTDLSRLPQARGQFLRQAQAMAQIRHPNLANILQFGTSPGNHSGALDTDGDCFYAIEFVEGESLTRKVATSGPLSASMALEIIRQVAQVLSVAEKCYLIHGEVNSSKILIVKDEHIPFDATNTVAIRVKVIDLDLDFRGACREPIDYTEKGKIVGAVTADADACALGEILWYSLFGKTLPTKRFHSFLGRRVFGLRVPRPAIALVRTMTGGKSKKSWRSASVLVNEIDQCRRTISFSCTSQRSKLRTLIGGFAVSAVLAGAVVYLTLGRHSGEQSIAVLPFQEVAQTSWEAFLAESIRDNVASRLINVPNLKVIGRSRVAEVFAKGPVDVRTIARNLGVTHILDGVLRHDGNRVRLRVRLIDARSGNDIWVESYDRKLREAINLQEELASDIANALNTRLKRSGQEEVRATSSYNPDAYTLYLRGRRLENSLLIQVANYEAAEALYSQAVALDPGFALAHARLACVLGILYRFGRPSDELRSRAYYEASEALRLQPTLGEAHFAKALNSYRLERDFDRALLELEIARRLLPNDTDPDAFISLIRRRQGCWRQAQIGLERVRQLAPLDRKYAEELHATSCLLRDWTSAAHHADEALKMSPSVVPLQIERALVDLWQSGSLDSLHRISAANNSCPDAEGDYTWIRWDVAMLGRDFSAANNVLSNSTQFLIPTILGAPMPKSYFAGCVSLVSGKNAQALEMFENARPSMEGEALAAPNDPLRHARLGLLYAYMGRKEDALREGARAVEITPVSEDAVEGHQWLCNLALIHARVGHTDTALTMIESLLRQPGCVSPLNEACMTLWDLRLRWQWDPLRKDPRFQKILADPEPKTIY